MNILKLTTFILVAYFASCGHVDDFDLSESTHFQTVLVSGRKYVNRAPKPLFFWSAPFTQNSMGIFSEAKQIAIFKHVNYLNDLANFSAIRKNSKIIEINDDFKDLFTFSNKYDAFSLNLSLVGQHYTISHLRFSGNQTYKTLHIKISPVSNLNKVVYVRLSFNTTTATPEQMDKWVKYFEKVAGKKAATVY